MEVDDTVMIIDRSNIKK